MTIEEMKLELSKNLSEERFNHSLGVMEMAVLLAAAYGANEEKARIAGLLHDCAKEIKSKERDKMIECAGDKMDEVMKTEKGLWHAPLGAELAISKYGVNDKDIYDAIFYHTIGKPDMPLLSKIVYVADMVEYNRDKEYAWVLSLRQAAFSNLDLGMLGTIDFTIKSLIDKGRRIHNLSVDARNQLILKLKQDNKEAKV